MIKYFSYDNSKHVSENTYNLSMTFHQNLMESIYMVLLIDYLLSFKHNFYIMHNKETCSSICYLQSIAFIVSDLNKTDYVYNSVADITRPYYLRPRNLRLWLHA